MTAKSDSPGDRSALDQRARSILARNPRVIDLIGEGARANPQGVALAYLRTPDDPQPVSIDYDPSGQTELRTSMTDGLGTVSYTYDAIDRPDHQMILLSCRAQTDHRQQRRRSVSGDPASPLNSSAQSCARLAGSDAVLSKSRCH